MQTTITLHERPVQVELTPAAERAAAARARDPAAAPLCVELELLFSCLIRKQVRFRAEAAPDAVTLVPGLTLRFRPVMTRVCSVEQGGESPPLTDFPIARAQAYVPHWVRIDYRRGAWQGEFGY